MVEVIGFAGLFAIGVVLIVLRDRTFDAGYRLALEHVREEIVRHRKGNPLVPPEDALDTVDRLRREIGEK